MSFLFKKILITNKGQVDRSRRKRFLWRRLLSVIENLLIKDDSLRDDFKERSANIDNVNNKKKLKKQEQKEWKIQVRFLILLS